MIGGGGTGGHLFPALSIANEIKFRFPDADMLFIGAENRMEMERVPAAGYRVIGLPVAGFNRKNLLKNFSVVVRLIKSLRIMKKIIRDFKPDIAIGVGGYSSGPALRMASAFHIPILIQEQNSYAGMTNKWLGKRAAKICVAYKGMDKYFPADRIVITGNPVRKELETIRKKDANALQYFGIEKDTPVVLVIGGSLGARTLNQSMLKDLNLLIDAGVHVIWQTGRTAYHSVSEELNRLYEHLAIQETPHVIVPEKQNVIKCRRLWISEFLVRMDYAYSVADLVVSRAGAGTLSELSILKKAAILVPSPNVAADHQTKNARTLSEQQAAVLIPDNMAEKQLIPTVIELLKDIERLRILSENIATFAQCNSAKRIVDEVVKIIEYELK